MDGEVSVSRDPVTGRIRLSCITDGKSSCVTMGPFNAWRALAMLAFMLEVKLPKAVLSRIEM